MRQSGFRLGGRAAPTCVANGAATGDGEVSRLLATSSRANLASGLLFAFAILFAVQWLSEIAPALISGTAPKGVTEIGALVNPVHVLDLAFILPGLIVTAVSLRRRGALGLLLAAPLLVFSAVMGVAILARFYADHARGIAVSAVPAAIVSVVAFASIYGAWGSCERFTPDRPPPVEADLDMSGPTASTIGKDGPIPLGEGHRLPIPGDASRSIPARVWAWRRARSVMGCCPFSCCS